MNSCHKQH